MARYLDDNEHLLPQPSIRLIVNALLTQQEMQESVKVLMEGFEFVESQS